MRVGEIGFIENAYLYVYIAASAHIVSWCAKRHMSRLKGDPKTNSVGGVHPSKTKYNSPQKEANCTKPAKPLREATTHTHQDS